MQDLTANVNTGKLTYTQAQLEERLSADGAVIGCRFDILDRFLNVLGDVGSIDATEVSIEWDTGRPVIGSLGMSMAPNQTINTPFGVRIKPWYRVQMLDGGVAEWPMGVYVWNVPNRRNIGMPSEEWDVTLGDQNHILTLAGPGPAGFTAPKGAVITEVIQHILVSELDIADTSGVVHAPTKLTSNLHWGLSSVSKAKAAKMDASAQHVYDLQMHQYKAALARYHETVKNIKAVMKWAHDHPQYTYTPKVVGKGSHRKTVYIKHRVKSKKPVMPKPPVKPRRPRKQPRFQGEIGTTWYEVLQDLHARLGYNVPWWDLTGRYRATPQPDLQTAPAAKTYEDSEHGLVIYPVNTSEVLTHLCNRVVAHGHSINGLYDIAVSDLDTLSPGHPLAQQQIGFYIDVEIADQISEDVTGLQKAADAELNRRLIAFNEINIDTMAWPVHEAFDIVGLRYSTDAEFGSGITCYETYWDLDLRTGQMTHALSRITPAGFSGEFD